MFDSPNKPKKATAVDPEQKRIDFLRKQKENEEKQRRKREELEAERNKKIKEKEEKRLRVKVIVTKMSTHMDSITLS